MKKLTVMFLSTVMLFGVIIGSSASASPAQPTFKEEVVIATSGVVTMFDPQRNNMTINKTVYYSTFSTLFKLDFEKKEFYGDLVESYTIDDAGLVWKFKLREGVKFHDGGALTANDVKFTYERARTSSHQATKVDIIKEITVVDDYNLEFVLLTPNQEFFESITDPGMSILSQAALTADEVKGLTIGSGAYYVKEYVPEDYCLLERFDDYFGEKPKTQRIRFRKIAEDSARVIALQTGEIDICLLVPSIEVKRITEDKKLELLQVPSGRIVYMALNQSVAPFDNLQVRQAVAKTIYRDDIILASEDGMAAPTNKAIPWTCIMYPEGVTGYSHDPEAAKALLAQAGHANGLEFSMMIDNAQWSTVAEVLQAQFGEIGVNAKIELLEMAVSDARVANNDYQVLISAYSFTTATDIPLRSLFYSTGVYNEAKFKDALLDKMLDDGIVESDPVKRLDIYRQIDQRIMDSAAWLPIFSPHQNSGVRVGVSGVAWANNGRHDFTYTYMPQ